jgi:hypothetical protein
MDVSIPNAPSATRNGHASATAPGQEASHQLVGKPRVERMGRFASALAHAETGLIIAVPLAPVIATFTTVLMYVDPLDPSLWRQATTFVPSMIMLPLNLVLVWLVLGLLLAVLRLGTASHANPSSHAQLHSRLLSIEPYATPANQAKEGADADPALTGQLDFVWKSLQAKGPKWMLGDGFISLWRQIDRMESQLNYCMPKDRVWARAQGLLLRLPDSGTPGSNASDLRSQLTSAAQVLIQDNAPDPAAELRGRGAVAQIQSLIESSRTDRYSGLLRARNMMLASCSMTSIALYGMFWLGIVALPLTVSQPILAAALFYTTIGALVGLFQLLYLESQSQTGVDDYGLSLARLIVAPQLAALAALVGVVLTSLATSTLGGSPSTPSAIANTIPGALDQIRNPANVLVAVAFALSPGLVFSRFRANIEQTKRDLSRTSTTS